MTQPRDRRFVVLCLQGFGDALEATPLVRQLREAVPRASITVVVTRAQVRDLFSEMPELADRVVYVPYWDKGLLRALPAIARLLFVTRSDASFLAYPAARNEYAMLARLIGSRVHYTHDYQVSLAGRVFGRWWARRVPITHKHNVLRNLDLAAAAGIGVRKPESYDVPGAWKAVRTRHDRVILHLGSIVHHGLEARRWPVESFVALGRLLQDELLDVALLAGPAEREETERAATLLGGLPVITGSMPEVARAIADAGVVVANDNGIAHLAAGVGTPVIALMGPTPSEHGPFGASAVIYRPSDCPPCFNIAKTEMPCVRNIDYACLKRDMRVDDVFALVIRQLGRSPQHEHLAKTP